MLSTKRSVFRSPIIWTPYASFPSFTAYLPSESSHAFSPVNACSIKTFPLSFLVLATVNTRLVLLLRFLRSFFKHSTFSETTFVTVMTLFDRALHVPILIFFSPLLVGLQFFPVFLKQGFRGPYTLHFISPGNVPRSSAHPPPLFFITRVLRFSSFSLHCGSHSRPRNLPFSTVL